MVVKKRKTTTRLDPKQVYKKHPRAYTGAQHFLTVKYINAGARTKDNTTTINAIIYNNENAFVELLILDNPHCLPEHIEQLKQWDMVTPLTLWCGMRGIPWWHFQTKIMKIKLLKVIGKIYIKPPPPKIRKFKNVFKSVQAVNKTARYRPDVIKVWDTNE